MKHIWNMLKSLFLFSEEDEGESQAVEIYLEDLLPAKRQEIIDVFGDPGDYDIVPIVRLLCEEEVA